MGGKKKKTMANKLAKMSDEERARYMQHRAEMEEEAKRRKEQLIATFMKKKVKKEEAFSRLNLAKINQNWHQVLRKAKCKEMKENVEHLKEWIDRVLAYKNRTITNLLKELDDAEEDYLNNFNTHYNHLQVILQNQTEYVEKLNAQYQKDLTQLLITAENEREVIFKEAEEEHIYLKTMIFRQEINNKSMQKEVESYMQKYYEAEHEFQSKLKQLVKSREQECSTIWQKILDQIAQYIEKTDTQRLHFAELKRQDAESSAEIAQNEERIKQEEAEIQNIKKQIENVRSTHELTLSSLNKEMEDLKQQFATERKNLQKDLQTDQHKLALLVEVSTDAIEHLKKIARKGEFIQKMAEGCKKFETDRERLANWFSIAGPVEDQNLKIQSIFEHKGIQKTPEFSQETQKDQELETKEFKSVVSKLEPLYQTSTVETPSPEIITSVQNITLYDKPPEESLSSSPSTSDESDRKSSSFVEGCVKSLEPLENFWLTYNKAEVDYLELKEEKKLLERENKQLRGMIRAILEAEALEKTIPSSKISTRVPSRKISACSAPLHRLILS